MLSILIYQLTMTSFYVINYNNLNETNTKTMCVSSSQTIKNTHAINFYMEFRHGLAMRILSVCLFVCLSVSPSIRPSAKRVNCDETVGRSVLIYIPYERSFSLVF